MRRAVARASLRMSSRSPAIGAELAVEQLDRDHPLQRLVEGAPDHAHAAPRDPLQQQVSAGEHVSRAEPAEFRLTHGLPALWAARGCSREASPELIESSSNRVASAANSSTG